MEEPVRVDLEFPRSGQRLEVTLPRRVLLSSAIHIDPEVLEGERPKAIVMNDRGRTDASH